MRSIGAAAFFDELRYAFELGVQLIDGAVHAAGPFT
jgi:hypothetical protein